METGTTNTQIQLSFIDLLFQMFEIVVNLFALLMRDVLSIFFGSIIP